MIPLIDFSRDADKQMAAEFATKRDTERKEKMNTERNIRVNYDFTDRDTTKVDERAVSQLNESIKSNPVDKTDDKSDMKYKYLSFDENDKGSDENELVK